MPGERFTSWLSEEERAALRALASELNCSENILVRYALRSLLFGAAVPGYVKREAEQKNTLRNHVTGAR